MRNLDENHFGYFTMKYYLQALRNRNFEMIFVIKKFKGK